MPAPKGSWRALRMMHADPLDVHVLRESAEDTAVVVRFAPGWARRAPVRCAAAEELVVLAGCLDLNGVPLAPGTVAYVPAGTVRVTTTSTGGCTAVAWFVGRLRWEAAVADAPGGDVATWRPGPGPAGDRWITPHATWTLDSRAGTLSRTAWPG